MYYLNPETEHGSVVLILSRLGRCVSCLFGEGLGGGHGVRVLEGELGDGRVFSFNLDDERLRQKNSVFGFKVLCTPK